MGSPAMAPLLHKWEASDIDTTTLDYNLGPVLRQIGIQTRTRDIFQLFQDTELVNEPLVIIIACICPPSTLLTLRVSPPAHTETLPRGVEVIWEAGEHAPWGALGALLGRSWRL